ncbi:MAG: hypothetical protein JO093_18395 [Acidobacteria bacterium]|nr:hypothetical protein [Acidobacteriota bacterium]
MASVNARRSKALVAAAVATILVCVSSSGGESAKQSATHAAHDQAPTNYAKLEGVQVIYAQIIDYVEDNECRGARRRSECGPLPMLRVKVLNVLKGKLKGDLVLELPYLAQQPTHPDKISTGEVVVITFIEEATPVMWSCGSLRPCDRAPASVLRVVDIFRHLRWG